MTFDTPIFAAVGQKETEADAVKGFVDTHVAGRKGSMISRKDVAPERNRDNDEHQYFGVVLYWLGDNQFTLNEGQQITADIIAVGEGGMRGQPFQQKFGVSVLIVRCKPVKRRRNRTS